jgi:phenylacetate-CoA ligase
MGQRVMTLDPTESVNHSVLQNRATVLRDQQRSFQALLRHVWQTSRFYRDLYSSAGVREHELAEITPKDLPIIDKKLLMENFDRVVTDPRLKKTDLQRWVHEYRNPAANYRQDFIVFHSSGSSGTKGIFVCTQSDWQFAASAMAGRLPLPVNYPIGKTRAAFYLVCHGNFSGVSVAARMPKTVYDMLVLSVVDSHQHTVKQLNEFQPHQLHGYAGSIHELSQLAMTGKLHISPKRIFVGGDKLAKNMEEDIGRAWAAPIYDLYSASESTYIAYRQSGEHEMSVNEELNILEVLDEANRSVAENQQGRAILSNLYNYAFPLIRYELGDFVTLGEAKLDSPLKTIKDIGGRVSDDLPSLYTTEVKARLTVLP